MTNTLVTVLLLFVVVIRVVNVIAPSYFSGTTQDIPKAADLSIDIANDTSDDEDSEESDDS